MNETAYNPLLSISIPTFNREAHLDYFFEVHLERFKKHNIAVFLSDNPSGDGASEVIAKWQAEYPFLYSTKLPEMVESDHNLVNSLYLPDTEYIWCFSDSYEMPEESLEKILTYLETIQDNPPDSILVNLVSRIQEIPQERYSDPNFLLKDLGWHLPTISCHIFRKDMIYKGDPSIEVGSNFAIVGFILHYFAGQNFQLQWLPDVNVITLKYPGLLRQGIGPMHMHILFKYWPAILSRLPDVYDEKYKKISVKKFVRRSTWFYWRRLLYLHGQSFITQAHLKEYEILYRENVPMRTRFFLKILLKMPHYPCAKLSYIIETKRRELYRLLKKYNLHKN